MFWNRQKFRLVTAISILLVAGFLVTSLASYFVSEKTKTYYHADGILKKVSPTEPRDKWYFRVRDLQDDYEINVDPDLANKDAMTIFIN